MDPYHLPALPDLCFAACPILRESFGLWAATVLRISSRCRIDGEPGGRELSIPQNTGRDDNDDGDDDGDDDGMVNVSSASRRSDTGRRALQDKAGRAGGGLAR